MIASRDWAGLLELESEMSVIANNDPGAAGTINYNLGLAHKSLGREGDIEEATLYYQKAIKMAKKTGDNRLQSNGVLSLSGCYVKMGRVDEAMDLHKSLCDDIGKESLDPEAIQSFVEILENHHHEHSRALKILEHHLDSIESSWGKGQQCRAYEIIARLYGGMNNFAKSIIYFERQLLIGKETKNVDLEAIALHGLGCNYGRMGDCGNAMAYLEEALVIDSERGDDRIGMTYCAMGHVLVAQKGREKEGILMYQKCVGLFEKGNTSENRIRVFLELGRAYTTIGAWDEAIAYLEKCISNADSIEDKRRVYQCKATFKQSLGKTYLEKFYWTDESLVGIPERNDELIRQALFWSEAGLADCSLEGKIDPTCFLYLAQENYFLGDSEKAHFALKTYLGGIVQLGPSYCQACRQTCDKDAIMEKCSVCKVTRYCSEAHCIQAWKKGRLCHKFMCPFLHRWRKIKPGKESTNDLCDELCDDFFERIRAFKPK